MAARLARYAPIGKVYTAYGAPRMEYRSTQRRRQFGNGAVVLPPYVAFDVQSATCVVEFSYIDKSVSNEESHNGGGHDRVRVEGCAMCFPAAE